MTRGKAGAPRTRGRVPRTKRLPGWFLGALAASLLSVEAAPVPVFTNAPAIEPQVNLRLFFESARFQPLLELSGNLSRSMDGLATGAVAASRLGVNSRMEAGPWHLKAGTYIAIFPRLYGGIFYSLAGGLVHDGDWSNFGSAAAPDWGWARSATRLEHLLTLDLTWRTALEPSARWVLEIKAGSVWNVTESTNDLKLRPGLSVQVGELRNPVATLFAQYEIWWRPYRFIGEPVNLLLPWENWVYAGALFHLGDGVSLGASLAWRHTSWRESASWRSQSRGAYEAGYDALVPSLTLVKRISL